MRKLRSKLKNLFKNQGSGVVLVVVAVAFIGILVGSLLTAVGYAYRLKLYDYNAKDNFYYLERAMDDVYTGVGNSTLTCMQDAYSEVINQMVEYSKEAKNYVTRDADDLNALFKKNFMMNVANADFLKADADALDNFLQSFISNSDVSLVRGKAKVLKFVLNGSGKEVPAGPVAVGETIEYSSIVIKNITLTRTANYNRSQANGDFTQTISTDIVINQPDFTMNFNSINLNYSKLYDYAMIADSGIEITQNKQELSISGNVYAAADFYNKGYNGYSSVNKESLNSCYNAAGTSILSNELRDKSGSAINNPSADKIVSSKEYPSVVKTASDTWYNYYNGKVSNNVATSLRNARLNMKGEEALYDGVNESSANSGLYIKGANVNMQSSELIVPGTIAVMDGARLSLYGKTGSDIGEADVWADNVVLGGIGDKDLAPYALLRANMHVRDDLELNANYSFFQLAGRYYGYGDSRKSDSREYVPTVTGDAQNAFFYKTTENGTTKLNARGHYNSSAIVINGQQAKLNLSELNALFVGGRSYVQLSKDYKDVERARAVEVTDETTNTTTTTTENYTVKDYVYDGNTDDFKTGESISLKTNQLAYVPMNITGVSTVALEEVTTPDKVYYNVPLPTEVQSAVPFLQILGAGQGLKLEKVPCIKYVTADGTTDYYYDFETIYQQNYVAKGITTINFPYQFKASETATMELRSSGDIKISSAEDLAKQFILYYYAELTNYDESSCRKSLKDIGSKYEGFNFDEGYLKIPNNKTNVYSSGAITAKSGVNFSIEADENLADSLTGVNAISGQESEYNKMLNKTTGELAATDVSDDMERRYQYVKWALEEYNPSVSTSSAEIKYVDKIVSMGEQYLTPINRYLNYNQIQDTTDLHPALAGADGTQVLDLVSGYKVWISNSDVVVSTDRADGVVQGIVITKGNVFFDNTVSKFEGLIIAGDKIFVDNFAGNSIPGNRGRSAAGNRVLASISASPEVVRSILSECMMMTGDDEYGAQARLLLSLFKSYESFAYAEGSVKTLDVNYKTIDTIQCSDVVRYSNWMKNVTTEP